MRLAGSQDDVTGVRYLGGHYGELREEAVPGGPTCTTEWMVVCAPRTLIEGHQLKQSAANRSDLRVTRSTLDKDCSHNLQSSLRNNALSLAAY